MGTWSCGNMEPTLLNWMISIFLLQTDELSFCGLCDSASDYVPNVKAKGFRSERWHLATAQWVGGIHWWRSLCWTAGSLKWVALFVTHLAFFEKKTRNLLCYFLCHCNINMFHCFRDVVRKHVGGVYSRSPGPGQPDNRVQQQQQQQKTKNQHLQQND